MTHDPRYPPRPQPPAPRQEWHQQYPAQQYPAPQYPAPQPHQRPNQQPYEWRHVTQQHPSPYDTAITAALPVVAPDTRRRSRAGVLFAGAVALSVVSAAVGGVAAVVMVQSPHSLISALTTAPADGAPPPARVQQGAVEQVAAKVVPSVVKLETKLGTENAEGSGIILDANGLILTNNHVVSVPDAGPNGLAGADTTATFNDGRTTSFSIV